MKKSALGILFFLISGILCAQNSQYSEPAKYALVIGNSAYTGGLSRLANPINDAADIAVVLEHLGFTVDLILNGSRDQMDASVVRLYERLSEDNNSYGFFFYAGHGVQSGGENFLIPVNASIPNENFLRDRAVSVQSVLGNLNDAGNSLNVVVLDACRDNPFGWSRSGTRGLQVVQNQPADSIIVYATSAGQTAADGDGRNGLFTGQLLANLATPGLEVKEVFNRTGADVAEVSGRQQIPAIYNQFFGTAYLGGAPGTAAAERPVPKPLPAGAGGSSAVKSQVNADKDAWKNKWVYLGGSFGLGSSAWNRMYHFTTTDFPYYYDYEEKETGLLFVPGLTVDFSLLSFLSIELDLGLGLGYADKVVVPVMPVLLKLGGRFAKMELFFDIGYTLGAGFTLGGTIGMNVGPGILFAKFLGIPKAMPFKGTGEYILLSGMTGFLGYKVGLGKKR